MDERGADLVVAKNGDIFIADGEGPGGFGES